MDDRLTKYIEKRIERFGHITICEAQTTDSTYYTFGDRVVRVSDHIKYGMTNVKFCDYTFIPQENDMYIFSVSPKHNAEQMYQMFLKIVTYQEARDFIRRLHEFSITLDEINEAYRISEVKRNSIDKSKLPWQTFVSSYIENNELTRKHHILDAIEKTVKGKASKGTLEVKLHRSENYYEELDMTQYHKLMKSVKKLCPKN